MEENTNMQAEVEIGESEISAFDDGFNDESSWDEDVAETADDSDAQPDEDAEGHDDGNEEPTEEEPANTEGDAEPEQRTEDEAGSQRFTLKFLGEEKEVSLDEMRELAEKGMNYDHVKGDRDALREKTKNLDALEDYGKFVQELAESGNTSVEELMESARARILMQKAEQSGSPITDEQARSQIRAQKAAKEEPETPPQKTEEDVRKEAIQRFISLYPGVKSEDIPQSVWDEADRMGDLIGPYQKYESQKLREELAQLKQNQKNRERSTGSRRSAGVSTQKDAFDEGWDSDS